MTFRVAVVGFMGFLLVGCGGTGETGNDTSAGLQPDPTYLFIQTARSGTFDGAGTLTLRGVTPVVTMFSNRPYRIARHVPLARVLALWDEGEAFALDPPNAGVTVATEGASSETVVLIRDAEMRDGEVIYTVSILEGEMPSTLAEPAVFIDNAFFDAAEGLSPVRGQGISPTPGGDPSQVVPAPGDCRNNCAYSCGDGAAVEISCYQACVQRCGGSG